jgi:hypothetical protein
MLISTGDCAKKIKEQDGRRIGGEFYLASGFFEPILSG